MADEGPGGLGAPYLIFAGVRRRSTTAQNSMGRNDNTDDLSPQSAVAPCAETVRLKKIGGLGIFVEVAGLKSAP